MSIAKWSHMWPSSVREILGRLSKPTEARPALLAVEIKDGKSVRNTYTLLATPPQKPP